MNLSEFTPAANYVTYTAAASTVTFWGLHISDVAVMVSSLAALCGAATQVAAYLERRERRHRRSFWRRRRGVKAAENYQDGETH